MNVMYVLLAVVSVLSGTILPMMYLRIKEKQLFDTLDQRIMENQSIGYKTIGNEEKQFLREEYKIVKEEYSIKILYPITIFSTILTGMPILEQLTSIPLWFANIYIGVVLMLFAILTLFIVLKILELCSETFRTYKNRLMFEYVYTHIDGDIWNIIVEAMVLELTVGIIISLCVSLFIGCTMRLPVENAYVLYCAMLVGTNIIVTKRICQKQNKCLKQLIMDEAGLS